MSRSGPYAGRCDRIAPGRRGLECTANNAVDRQTGPHRGLLRSRQNGHREIEHIGVQQTFLRSGANQSAGRSQVQLRTVPVPDVGRRPRSNGPDALLHHQHVHRLGRRAGEVDRRRDTARHRRSAGLRRGRRTDRRPQAVRSRRGRGLGLRRGDRRARSPAHSAPPTRWPPGWSSRTASTPARSRSTATATARWKRSASSPTREGYALEHCYAYSDSITDLPMLEAVGHPTVVNPDRALRKEADGARLAGADVLQTGVAA